MYILRRIHFLSQFFQFSLLGIYTSPNPIVSEQESVAITFLQMKNWTTERLMDTLAKYLVAQVSSESKTEFFKTLLIAT